MITIKLPYKVNDSDKDIIYSYQKDYSCLLRSAYNQKKKGKNDIDVRKYLKNIKDINCWFGESALYEAKGLLSNKSEKVIFGSKKQFIRRCKGLITNEEFKMSRVLPLYSVGQANQKGNRLFDLNIINDNQIVFKPKKGIKVIIDLPNLKPNIKKQLFKLEELANDKQVAYTIKLNDKYIFISFDEFKNEIIPKNLKERYLSFDLNPNHIGLSIVEYKNDKHNIVHTEHFDLTNFIKDNTTNKIKFETIEICKKIMKLVFHYKCKYVFIEDLIMVGKNHNKGKALNKLINNSWFRNLFTNNIIKRCNINNIKVYKINPAYSSYIGNLQHNYSDPVNASIEIGRRGYEVVILKNKDNFYPKMEIKDSILHQWKETDIDRFSSWKGLFSYIKNSRMRYRVQMDDVEKHHIVYRQEYRKPIGLFKYIFK